MPDTPVIAGAGTILTDYLAPADNAFLDSIGGGKGGSIPVTQEVSDALLRRLKNPQKAPGGSAPNTMAALAAWGIQVRMIGMTGQDADGEFCHSCFADTAGFKYHPELPTGRCISLVTEDGERTMRTMLGASTALTPEDISPQDMAGANLLLFEGYLFYNQELSAAILNTARNLSLPVAFDLSAQELVRRYRQEMKLVLKRDVSILFANRDEAAALLEAPENVSDADLLDGLADYAPLAVLKLGRRGALIRENGITYPVDPVFVPEDELKDTTGAGDLWQAGFLYGYLRKMPLALCGRFASAAAAEVVKVMGARLAPETLEKLQKQFTRANFKSNSETGFEDDDSAEYHSRLSLLPFAVTGETALRHSGNQRFKDVSVTFETGSTTTGECDS